MTRRADELDELDELDTQDAVIFADSVARLIRHYPVQIIGGCCGTDVSHIRAIAGIHKRG